MAQLRCLVKIKAFINVNWEIVAKSSPLIGCTLSLTVDFKGGHDDDHYVRRGGGRSGSIGGSGSETQGHRQAGVHHLKSLIKGDSGDSRAGR